MSTFSNEHIGAEAVQLASEIDALCRGRPTASVFMALSMMLGGSAAAAAKPDFEGMMALVERSAFEQFQKHIQARSR